MSITHKKDVSVKRIKPEKTSEKNTDRVIIKVNRDLEEYYRKIIFPKKHDAAKAFLSKVKK